MRFFFSAARHLTLDSAPFPVALSVVLGGNERLNYCRTRSKWAKRARRAKFTLVGGGAEVFGGTLNDLIN